MAIESPWPSLQPLENRDPAQRSWITSSRHSHGRLVLQKHFSAPCCTFLSTQWTFLRTLANCLPFQPHSHTVPALEDYAAMNKD